ncbi:hypothetical protein HDU93_002129, partial [Gonapodya sp. JEL0774]
CEDDPTSDEHVTTVLRLLGYTDPQGHNYVLRNGRLAVDTGGRERDRDRDRVVVSGSGPVKDGSAAVKLVGGLTLGGGPVSPPPAPDPLLDPTSEVSDIDLVDEMVGADTIDGVTGGKKMGRFLTRDYERKRVADKLVRGRTEAVLAGKVGVGVAAAAVAAWRKHAKRIKTKPYKERGVVRLREIQRVKGKSGLREAWTVEGGVPVEGWRPVGSMGTITLHLDSDSKRTLTLDLSELVRQSSPWAQSHTPPELSHLSSSVFAVLVARAEQHFACEVAVGAVRVRRGAGLFGKKDLPAGPDTEFRDGDVVVVAVQGKEKEGALSRQGSQLSMANMALSVGSLGSLGSLGSAAAASLGSSGSLRSASPVPFSRGSRATTAPDSVGGVPGQNGGILASATLVADQKVTTPGPPQIKMGSSSVVMSRAGTAPVPTASANGGVGVGGVGGGTGKTGKTHPVPPSAGLGLGLGGRGFLGMLKGAAGKRSEPAAAATSAVTVVVKERN